MPRLPGAVMFAALNRGVPTATLRIESSASTPNQGPVPVATLPSDT